MHDIKFIRTNPQDFDAGLARRGLPPQSNTILRLDEIRRGELAALQELQSKRNQLAKEIGMAKARKEDASVLMEAAKRVNEGIAALEKAEPLSNSLLATLPNIPADDVPQGKDEKDNKQVREWGKKPELGFKP